MAFFTNSLGERLRSIAQKTPLFLFSSIGSTGRESLRGSCVFSSLGCQSYHNLINKWDTSRSTVVSSSSGVLNSDSSCKRNSCSGTLNLLSHLNKRVVPAVGSRNFTMSANLNNGTTGGRFALEKKYQGLEKNVWVEFIDLNAKLQPLNLGQGFPDFMPAENVIKELLRTCEVDANPLLHQYTRSMGHPRLVKALADLYGRLINRPINPFTEVIVTGGAYGALFCCIMSTIGPGDEVIIIEPYFDCYEPLVRLAGGVPRFISLKPVDSTSDKSSNWKLDMNELRSVFNSNTKAIVINTPNNPLGKVFTKEELTDIGNLCKEFNAMVISDEVYEWLVYEGNKHVRMASLDGMWERTVTIGSAGKTFSLTGWKCGWAYGPANLIGNMQVAHQNCVYTCPTLTQEALAGALELEIKRLDTPNSFFYKMVTDLKDRRDMMSKAVKDSGMIPVIPDGGYFMMINWKPLESKTDLSGENDECADYRFVKWLAKTWKLLGIPPTAFYSKEHKFEAEDYIRFCFYKKTDTLQKAGEILKQWKNST